MPCIQRESLSYGNASRKQTDLANIVIVFILFFDNDGQTSCNRSAILSRCTNRIVFRNIRSQMTLGAEQRLSEWSLQKGETPNGFALLKKEENRQFIRRKSWLHDSQCPASYAYIRKTRAVPSFPARGLPQCCIRTTAAQFPNQSYPAVPVPARAESS